ncbi:MAG: MFS transporter [Bifidobacterium sp.]|uniref:MFS transporter n=1 Tax=Bifidobacterium sp. TaxID=41200 RepID=UPI0039EA2237
MENTTGQKISRSLLWSVISLAMLTFLGILSETSLNIAYSSLMREYGIEASVVQWLTTGYLLILAIVIPSSTYLVRRFATVRLFQCAVSIFMIGTVLGACAPSFSILLCARLIMAIGTGISLPLMTNVVLEKAQFHQRGMLMGIVSMVISAGPAIGPVYGGIVLQFLTWHYIFIIMVPFLVGALIVGTLALPDISDRTRAAISPSSMMLVAVGLGSLMISFSFAYSWHGDWRFWLVLLLGIAIMSAFVILQMHVHNPLINVKVFSYQGFSIGIATIMISQACVLGINFMLPLLLQNGLRLSSMTAALLLLPGAAVGSMAAPRVGSSLRSHRATVMMTVGFSGMLISAVVMSLLPGSAAAIMVIYVLFMTGACLVATPGQTHSLNQLPPSMNADGSAVLNTLQQLSGALGTTIASTLITAFQSQTFNGGSDSAQSYTSAFSKGMPPFIALIVIAVLLTLRLRHFEQAPRSVAAQLHE